MVWSIELFHQSHFIRPLQFYGPQKNRAAPPSHLALEILNADPTNASNHSLSFPSPPSLLPSPNFREWIMMTPAMVDRAGVDGTANVTVHFLPLVILK